MEPWLRPEERDASRRVGCGADVGAIAIGIIPSAPFRSGSVGGFWDEVVVMRVTDAALAFRSLLLALVAAPVLGPDFVGAMVAISLSLAPVFIRLIRGEVLQEVTKEYVEASRALGASGSRQMFRHVLPNIRSPILVHPR